MTQYEMGTIEEAKADLLKQIVNAPLSVDNDVKSAVLIGMLQVEANGITSHLKELARATKHSPDELHALMDVFVRVYVDEVLHGKIVSGSAITRHTREARKLREYLDKNRGPGAWFGKNKATETSLIEEAEQIAAEIVVAKDEYNELQIKIASSKA